MTDRWDAPEKIEKLVAQFERDAKKLGYDLMVLVAYDKEYDRHQINWNDTSPMKDRQNACEGVAISLYKLANEDPDTIKYALQLATARTHIGAQKMFKQFQAELDTLIDSALRIGEEIGQQALQETKQEGITDPMEQFTKSMEKVIDKVDRGLDE